LLVLRTDRIRSPSTSTNNGAPRFVMVAIS
jgi:hypothetical protein